MKIRNRIQLFDDDFIYFVVLQGRRDRGIGGHPLLRKIVIGAFSDFGELVGVMMWVFMYKVVISKN